MSERLQGAVYLGLVDNPMGVRLGAGEIRAAGKGRITVPLHIMLPAESVAFLPEEGWVVAHLSVQVATRNTKNDKGTFEHSAFRVRRSAATDRELVSVMMELNLPEGVHLVAVGLRDDATRESSFVTTTLQLQVAAGEETGVGAEDCSLCVGQTVAPSLVDGRSTTGRTGAPMKMKQRPGP